FALSRSIDILTYQSYVLTYERAHDRPSARRSCPARQAQGGRGRPHSDVPDRGWATADGRGSPETAETPTRSDSRQQGDWGHLARNRHQRFSSHPGDGRSRVRRAHEALQMILADVNVLVYAFRQDVPQHPICHAWLDGILDGEARFGVSPLALGAVVRV